MTVDAVRFYEKAGLLKPAVRSEGGYRLYGEQDLTVLMFIKRVQQLGFSLREVREFLLLQDETPDCCPGVRDLFQKKLEEVKEKMKQLKQLETELAAAVRKCDTQVRASHRRHMACPVLKRLRTGGAL